MAPQRFGFRELFTSASATGTGLGRSKFGRAQLPTDRITLEGFVRLLVGDFAVPPASDNWEAAME